MSDLQMGNDLLDALISKAQGHEDTAAALAIPHLEADPITSGSFLLSLLDYTIRCYADHCRETPEQIIHRLWSKPEGAR